jgi:hypothetical protein
MTFFTVSFGIGTFHFVLLSLYPAGLGLAIFSLLCMLNYIRVRLDNKVMSALL